MRHLDIGRVLEIAGVSALTAYLAILAVKYALSRRYAATHRLPANADGAVTVLQPILSGDPYLEELLTEDLHRTPPWATFLWLIDGDDAEAHRITKCLIAEFNNRASRLICPPADDDTNAKTAKLDFSLPHVRTPYVAVLDDDTMLGEGDLSRAILALERCTLYTGLPCYLPGANPWSSLVSHFVNNNSILTYLSLNQLVGPVSINGMFYVMKTDSLREMGGFKPILRHLCDDYALAQMVKSSGGTIEQGVAPLRLRTTIAGPRHYVRLMHRWMVFANLLALDQPARIAALLFVLLALPPLLLWLGFVSLIGAPRLAMVLAAVLATRHLALRRLHWDVLGGLPGFSAITSIFAELLQPLHWLHGCIQTKLYWRRRRILANRDGTFLALDEKRR